jgi:hypothetical protein
LQDCAAITSWFVMSCCGAAPLSQVSAAVSMSGSAVAAPVHRRRRCAEASCFCKSCICNGEDVTE